jgi:hypothetical protein
MEYNETLAEFKRKVGDVGSIYSAHCSLVVNHGYGRLSVAAKCDLRQSVLHLEISSLSADLEQSPIFRFDLPIKELPFDLPVALLSWAHLALMQPEGLPQVQDRHSDQGKNAMQSGRCLSEDKEFGVGSSRGG